MARARTATGRLCPGGQGGSGYAVFGSQAPDHSVATRLSAFAERQGLSLVAVVDHGPAGLTWGERLAGLLSDAGHQLRVIMPASHAWRVATRSAAIARLPTRTRTARIPVRVVEISK